MDTYLDLLKEVNYIVSGKNKIYNFEDWKNNKKPVLYIVGFSGSGKSTIGRQLAEKYKAEYISLDIEYNHYAKKMMKKYNIDDINNDKIIELATDYMNKYMKSLEKKKAKAIAEGVEIAYYPNPSYFKNKPLIILGTSVIISSLRAFIRDRSKYGKDETIWQTAKYILLSQSYFIKQLKNLERAVK